ncbi:MAG: glycosyltransferase family 4 protein [Candidatus Thorarchaeota archaeon]
MNILFINENWYPEGGGGEIYFHYLSNELSKLGHNIFIISGGSKKYEFIKTKRIHHFKIKTGLLNTGNFSILTLIKRGKFFLKLFFYIHKIKKFNIHLIHTRTPICSVMGYIIKNIFNVPLIFSVLYLGGLNWTKIFENSMKSLIFKLLELFSLKLDYNKIHIISQNFKNYISSIGISPEKIRYIPNGIDFQEFQEINEQISANFLDIPVDNFIIGYIGSLEKVKRINRLIQLFIGLNDQNISLVIAGTGSEESNLNKKYGNIKNLLFIGKIEHSKVPKLISSVDALILLSSSEGFPGVCLEALAMNRPVIVSNEIKNKEFNEFLNYNYSIDVNNQEEFNNLINHLRKNKKSIINFLKNKRDNLIQGYSWDKISSKFLSIYQETLSSNRIDYETP